MLRSSIGVLAAIAVLAGCGSSGSTASRSEPVAATSRDIATPSGAPSAPTRMICAPEAQADLAATLGTKTTSDPEPTWRAHVYACDYRYANGSFTLSVHQLPDAAGARATYARLTVQRHPRMVLQGIGERATTTADGSVLVQKDDDVLVVDISHLPARFGVPADTRANAAISIAATIIGCWTGA